MLVYTPVEDVPKIYADLRSAFRTGKTKPVAYRKEQLSQLAWMLRDHEDRWTEALKADLGRHSVESLLLDTSATLAEIKDAYNNVEKWAKTEKAPFALNWFAMKPEVRKEPKGVVLLISPFNFPLFLLAGHLAGALAAGNAVVIKPSELTPAVCELLAELVPKYLDPETCRVVNGDVPVVSKLLELPWDHILYTGSTRVAKIVCAAAAKHLTPVTTELGGKSPVIIDPKCDMLLAARRILWGKVANCGQICVAPDYILVPREAKEPFVEALKKVHKEFFPDGNPAKSDSYSRIVSEPHTARLKKIIDNSKGRLVFGGEADVQARFIAPTVFQDVSLDDSTMEEEIFGPVLPIVTVENVDEAINIVNEREHPLSLYVFTRDPKFKAKVFDNTTSGSAVANDVVLHVGAHGLPFGGIGPSGSGYVTGKYGFDIFTHLRCTLDNPKWVDSILMKGRYPPFTEESTRTLKKALSPSLPPRVGTVQGKRWGLWVVFALAGVISAVLINRRIA